MKIQLPNGCSISQLSVTPKNWQTKKPVLSKDWFIKYRFYDPNHPTPKQVMLKGMNAYKAAKERQDETKKLIDRELSKLREGYNPFHKAKEDNVLTSLSSSMPLLSALKEAYKQASVAKITARDLNFAISQFERALTTLQWEHLTVSEVSKKHIKLILEAASNSPDRFNKNRSYLMILFSILSELEVVAGNTVRDIKKKKVVKKLRAVLTDEERTIVNSHLKANYPEFHRFLNIFFHSGARISELIRLNEADVDLSNQRFKVLVLKGSQYKEVWKIIKDIALPFWQDLLKDCEKGAYLFSRGLKPGATPVQSYQIDKRWNRLVKKKLGITADFYSLKHLHTTEVVDFLNEREAANHNSHTSTNMVNKVYDVKNKTRTANKVKELNNSFA